jgi:tetratricopeptide (TPR) repeat protein
MKTTVIALLFFALPSAVFAETVVFKSGRKADATIISKTEQGITLDINGSLASYGIDEVDTIDGKKADTYKFSKQARETVAKVQETVSVATGLAYLEAKQFDEAINEFTKVIEKNPSSPEAYYNRGLAYAKKGDTEHAIADYSKAIDLNPRDADTYFNRALAYYKKGAIQEAIDDYTKVIQLDPRQADVYYNRALAYGKKQDYEAAWKDVETAQGLGYQVNADFLQWLKEASGKK